MLQLQELFMILPKTHRSFSWNMMTILLGRHLALFCHCNSPSLAIHPNGELVATGQVASKKNSPKILVWSTVTLKTVAVLEGFHERSVCSLGFSPDGNYLLSAGTDDKNSICVYDWKQQKQVATAYGSSQKVCLIIYLSNFKRSSLLSSFQMITHRLLHVESNTSNSGS
jgi:WD40 repeat protein